MAVLIDPPRWPAHGRLWSHLVSDSCLSELHAFASACGLPARGFEGDHYDVPAERYSFLVAAGALPVSGRELLTRLVASGLRVPKRRGEKVLLTRPLPGGGFVDAVASALPPPASRTVAVEVLLRDQERPRLLLAELDPAWSELPQAEVTPAASVLEAGVWAAARVGVPVAAGVLDQVGYLRERRGPQGGSWTYTAVLSAVVPPNGASGWCSMVEATRRLAGAPVWPLVERVVNGR